jgi:hypothetical protein
MDLFICSCQVGYICLLLHFHYVFCFQTWPNLHTYAIGLLAMYPIKALLELAMSLMNALLNRTMYAQLSFSCQDAWLSCTMHAHFNLTHHNQTFYWDNIKKKNQTHHIIHVLSVYTLITSQVSIETYLHFMHLETTPVSFFFPPVTKNLIAPVSVQVEHMRTARTRAESLA